MKKQTFKYPGIPSAMDGNTAVVMCERESTDAAGAFPITPSTQMGEYFEANATNGHLNVGGRPLLFIEPEGEHASAAVTAGFAMTGWRAANFSSGQGIAYMHESLYAAVGKRLTYVLNMGCRAMTKASLSVHAGHDDYHAIDDTGFFQLFAKDIQQVADFNILAHRIAELSLTPGVMAQDGFLTTHMIESLLLPERELIAEFLGLPDDLIDCPTPAQKLLFGPRRRRVPELWDVDNPLLAGPVQNQESYMQQVAAQRPYFFDPILGLAEQAFEEYFQLTGRRYRPIEGYLLDDAEYLIMGQGSMIPNAEAVADYLRTKKIKVGVLNLSLWRPFPGGQLAELLKGRKGVTVLERLDQPLAEDLPMIREVRSVLGKCLENGREDVTPHANYPAYRPEQVPLLYSGSYGMGSRDLQPEALIGAVENMLPEGAGKKFFYLSIDFIHRNPATPKQEIYSQSLEDSFPGIGELAVRGSENPNLLPEGSISVRIHSIGGWGAIATGKNLTMTLADILGYQIKSNPKYGSEKKGQPTTYYLSVAPEPIRINCEYYHVDTVLSPDPNVFAHTNPLGGLRQGGIFIIQSDAEDPAEVWASIPLKYRKLLVERQIRCYCLDAFKIAREEASDPELLFRMQGIAFQGAFFKAAPLMQEAKLSETSLFEKIETQLRHKFGAKGEQMVADNLRVVERGFAETREICEMPLDEAESAEESGQVKEFLPAELKLLPASKVPISDIQRFWEEIGQFYHSGRSSQILSDPFAAMSLMPASSGIFRDLSGIRFEHPEFIPERCTGCGDCWVACPDSALPGLVNEIGEIFETLIDRLERKGHEFSELRKAVRPLETELRERIDASEEDSIDLQALLQELIAARRENASERLQEELALLQEEMAELQLAVTKPYYRTPEKEAKGSGGLLSITVNPYSCKGCMECVAVCGDKALRNVPQTAQSIAQMRRRWELWHDLPTTQERFRRIDDLEEAIGALEGLLLDKQNYLAMVGGDGACLGCAEKTLLHLFTATVTALMQPRVSAFLAKLESMIEGLEEKIHQALTVHFDDPARLSELVTGLKQQEVTLADIAGQLDPQQTPVDLELLRTTSQLLSELKELIWRYREGVSGRGRCKLGLINATGCSSVWGSSYPFNPYPVPWANHLFQDSPSLAMGVFEGHMRKMADNFKLVRRAEVELGEREAEDLTYFNWEDFSDEEFLLCPPVVTVGGDGAMYDIGFQNLSRMLMTGKPIKVVVLDTQVYSNTGGQACTSGFTGQISDMATFGSRSQGKQEIRKEIGLIGMAHRTSYVMQSSLASASHLMEGFIEGMMCKRPALFNLFTSCQPEHGIADDAATRQARLALESRAYPFFRYNPDKGVTPPECFDLDGNPDPDRDWTSYELHYLDDAGEQQSMEITLTFADYAASEGRFRPHFKPLPRETWDDEKLKPVAEFLELEPDEREELLPFIWAVDRENRLTRLAVSATIITATEDRRSFWKILKSMAGIETTARDELAEEIKGELLGNLTRNLIALTRGAADPSEPEEI